MLVETFPEEFLLLLLLLSVSLHMYQKRKGDVYVPVITAYLLQIIFNAGLYSWPSLIHVYPKSIILMTSHY